METHNENLCKGLHLMYLGAIISIVTGICAVASVALPPLAIVFLIATLGAGITSFAGLVKIRNEHADYKNALIALVMAFICGLFSRGDGGFASLMSMIQSIAGLFETYFVIRATSSFLRERGFIEQAEQGDKVWKWTLISTIGMVVTGVLTVLLMAINMGLAGIGLILLLIALLLSIYGMILYLGYLRESSEAL